MAPPRRTRLANLSRSLVRAQRPIRVLAAIAWPERVRRDFLKGRSLRTPKVSYPALRYDAKEVSRELRRIARRCDPADPLQHLIADTAEQYREVVAMLEARGQPAFTKHSRRLYGGAADQFLDGRTTNLDLARHLLRLLSERPASLPRSAPVRPLSVERARERLQRRFDKFFGPGEVSVEVSQTLSADAAAGSTRVRLREGASFDRARLAYLEQHEGYVHILTSLNGRAQPVLTILGKASPRVVRYNEGLAVFGEWASGTLTSTRLERLSERVILNHLAEEGASFIDLYRHERGRGATREQAFDQAYRVFRGGNPAGGAFFTKDTAYLDHFMRAYNFFRVALRAGTLHTIDLLFAGKVAYEDLPVLAEARDEGLLVAPRYRPPWLADPAWLSAHLALSTFLDKMNLDRIARAYRGVIAGC